MAAGFTEDVARHDVCRLVTTGRHSGRLHDIEIWFGTSQGVVYIISGNGPGADWYRNARSNPAVTIRFGETTYQGSARPVTDAAERRLVGEIMRDRYGGWGGDPEIGLTEHDWLWNVPVLAIDHLEMGPWGTEVGVEDP